MGIFVALLSAALLADSAGSASSDLWFGVEAWRWMFMVGVIPALGYGILALLIPKSPAKRTRSSGSKKSG